MEEATSTPRADSLAAKHKNGIGNTFYGEMNSLARDLEREVKLWRDSHDAAVEDAKKWRRDAQEMFGQLKILNRTLLQLEALKSVVAVLAAKAEVSDEDVLMLLDVALEECVKEDKHTVTDNPLFRGSENNLFSC